MVNEDTVEADELVEVELSEVVVEAVLVEAVTGRVVVRYRGRGWTCRLTAFSWKKCRGQQRSTTGGSVTTIWSARGRISRSPGGMEGRDVPEDLSSPLQHSGSIVGSRLGRKCQTS